MIAVTELLRFDRFFAALKPLFDRNILQNQTEFTLPEDILIPNGLNDEYQEINSNIYTGSTKEYLKSSNATQCFCNPTDGCNESCVNRYLQVECSDSCHCGEKCGNQSIKKQLFKPAVLFKTEKKGYGVKSIRKIEKGNFILEYIGEIITKEEYEERTRTIYRNDQHSYGMSLKGQYIIDAHKKGNISRYVNHSCNPNCEIQSWNVNGLPRLALFSIKEIQRAEELTYDYKFSPFGDNNIDCHCDDANCKRIISFRNKRKNCSDVVKEIDFQLLKSMKKANVINWWNDYYGNMISTVELLPTYIKGDGNCLLHATSVAMYGHEDKDLSLRQKLYEFITSEYQEKLRSAWKSQQEIWHAAANLVLSDEEWTAEWRDVIESSSARPVGTETYQSLEEIHIFALANLIRKTIIVFADKTMYSHVDGGKLSPINFGGIYTPTFFPYENCDCKPILLIYNKSHFSTLFCNSDLMTNEANMLPLTDIDQKILPIQFEPTLSSNEREILLKEYLNAIMQHSCVLIELENVDSNTIKYSKSKRRHIRVNL